MVLEGVQLYIRIILRIYFAKENVLFVTLVTFVEQILHIFYVANIDVINWF